MHLVVGTTFLASSHTGLWPPAPSGPVVDSMSSFPAQEAPPRSQNRWELWGDPLPTRFCYICQLALCCLDAHEATTTTSRPRILFPGNCLPQGSVSNPSPARHLLSPSHHSSRSNPKDLQTSDRPSAGFRLLYPPGRISLRLTAADTPSLQEPEAHPPGGHSARLPLPSRRCSELSPEPLNRPSLHPLSWGPGWQHPRLTRPAPQLVPLTATS